MKFYQKLRNIRKEHAMSQEDLAEQLGVSRQAVSKWESGQGFPETEKLLQISSLFGVSLDYLLKDEPATGNGSGSDGEEPGYYASREAVTGYLLSKRQGAVRIGIGVATMILSTIFVFVPGGGKGRMLLLLGVAIGVAILVIQGFRPKRYAELEIQPLLFDSAFLKEFRDASALRRKRYGLLVVIGIFLIIATFAAIMLFDSLPLASHDRAMALLPPLWATAVFLFIQAGSALHAEGIIANNTAHMQELQNDKRNGWVWGSVMPLAAMVFLLIGFLYSAWHPGWIVFPIAAMLCTGISGLRNSRQ